MKCVRFAFLALAATLLAVGAYAQATGSIEGRIIDETKAPLPGVTVEATSPNLQVPKVIASDPQGKFKVILLPPGTYAVRFTLAGFATQEQANIAVGAGQVVTLQVQMRSAFKEEVAVTGTLIPRPTLEAMSPVTTLDVEDLSYRGITRLEDLLTSLPQVFAAQNSTVSNGSSGTATVDLRYLGTERTLVLIDGRRMSSGDAFATAPDLNFIPSFLVKRVDILTGGASATYGADAVAGVVNFVLDKDFEGVRAGVNFGCYEHNNDNKTWEAMDAKKGFTAPTGQAWDGGSLDAYVALGGKFADGKGSASAYIDYRKTAGLLKNRRDYTNCSVVGLGATGPACGGSGTWPGGRFLVFDSKYNQLGDYTLDTSGPGNTLRKRTSADVFNYAVYNWMQRPDQRFTAGGFVNYEWNKHAQGYVEVMLMNDYTDGQIAPSGDFNNTTLVNCNNPMLSADEVQKFCTNAGLGPNDIANVTIGRRNVEGGPRDSRMTHTDFRLVAGLKGEITKAWSYDVYGLDAEVKSPQEYANDLNTNNIQDALIVDGNPNDPSTWHCRSGNPGCVPWNIFKVGGVTQAALAYLSLPEVLNSGTKTQVLSGKVTGDLKDYGIAFPSASEGIRIALGTEYRKEFLFVHPDLAFQTALGAGSGGPTLPVDGMYSVKEAFAEALIPIVQGARGAKDLSLELGYRYSDYNINGSHPSWKVQGTYAPSADFKLRAGINRATRAPNVQELFTPQGLGLGGATDPCSGPTPAFTQAQCAFTGVTAAQYGHVLPNPAGQYNTLSGGNPNLAPEIADTTTYGIVITPSGLPGFTAAFDYYKIKIKDTIASLGADDILKQCATTGAPALCALIHRDVAGTLWLFQSGYTMTTNANIGNRESEGVDVNLTYSLAAGKSLFGFNVIGTYLMTSSINTGLYQYDCVGYFGNQCGVPNAKWRHLARFSWEIGNLVLNLGWRMVGAVTVDAASSNPALADPGTIPTYKLNGSYHYPAYHYVDLAASFKITKGTRFTLGVNNIADKEPPLGAGFSPNDYGTGFYGTYDPYGRYIHSSITFSF
jgi:iron complex outermembrane recepter protein